MLDKKNLFQNFLKSKKSKKSISTEFNEISSGVHLEKSKD